jgi:hypothetical protein
MLAFELVLAIVFIIWFAVSPHFLIRHLRWSPMERFFGSIGMSFALLYLASGAI